MKNAKLNWVRLPIPSLENCRELGGYSTNDGQQTKWHSFLRSSDMSKLNKEDINFLKAYGVKTIVDLRRDEELELEPNPLSDMAEFDYYNLPFITQSIYDITKYNDADSIYTMGDFYIELLKQKTAVKEIFQTISGAKDGCILFHCRVGKDRTGVLAMLLLGLAGVEKKDIVANYEVSYSKLESLHDLEDNTSFHFIYSHREYILQAYDHIIHNYGTFENYLHSAGISKKDIQKIRERLIQFN
ncbi:tyrosine-protein phosphatase [Oceanobacillus sp. Castelsardo]|uniref:tyrosine-protein phosphatase n=1 Tax=Oceanobacillus sp. Castelsardo TaxID=1851204 RepID=UPI0008387096|nr:tyrosine-protein phosphatase [Oceanobacillus sp. Castelsardo]